MDVTALLGDNDTQKVGVHGSSPSGAPATSDVEPLNLLNQ